MMSPKEREIAHWIVNQKETRGAVFFVFLKNRCNQTHQITPISRKQMEDNNLH